MSDKKVYLPLTDIENVLPILNKISIFGGLSDKQLDSVFKMLKVVSYDKDETIFRQGEPSSHIYIIKSGRVRLCMETGNAKLALIEFGVGDCFGESSLIGIQPHTATAIATENTELIVLSGKALSSLYILDKDSYIMIILNVAREICRRLTQADNTLLHYVLEEK
ncbi:MAG: cyclic nucleotide-binding domain-containing protein [Candidatus Omnitrophota bacterium]|nr:MAG: cyclic nucleotide-binding domain-containing protein [Candidatus Omnitrophota bacterium]